MKIFLTEMEEFGHTYAGPNIVAPNLHEAGEAALVNGLTVVGELVEFVVDEGSMHYMKNNFSLQERTLH